MDVRGRNHVTVTGRTGGPVVVPAHGFGCDQNMWRLVVPAWERDFYATGHCPQLSAPEETVATITAFVGTSGLRTSG